jgi:hypothetical protein
MLNDFHLVMRFSAAALLSAAEDAALRDSAKTSMRVGGWPPFFPSMIIFLSEKRNACYLISS